MKLRYKTEIVNSTPQKTLQFNINGGFVEVLNNQVSLLVTGADLKV